MGRSSALGLFSALCLALGFTIFLKYDFGPPEVYDIDRHPDFSWSTLPASRKPIWRNCAPGRQCARLLVPLNYSEPQGRQAAIALVRIPSIIPRKFPQHRGPVLFNPGGPGGSGVALIMGSSGNLLHDIVGPEFDIIGFDPRGVGHSTPRASFFKTDIERFIWGAGVASVNASKEGVARVVARNHVMGQLAAEQDDGYLRHLNTDQTARDMLSIAEALGREKLQYWGFSYGSVLGATFASMFPDKIERMIIDGVVDAENYYDTLWSNNLLDTDKTLQTFFTGCYEAGPLECPFYAPSPEAIRQNLTNLYDSVRAKPIAIKTRNTYGVLDYNHIRTVIFASLYSPYALFPIVGKALAELAGGDGTSLFELVNPPQPQYDCSCDSSKEEERKWAEVTDASATILCNDGADIPGDLESSRKYFEQMAKKSEWGDIWSSIRLGCVGWPKFPKDHFQGPFVANTSHPLLLIGNTADPVTPLWAAKKMSRGFKDSVVLTQDSPGHCSISAPSLCTVKYIRDYFIHGTLPEPDTVCQPVTKPFPGSVAKYGSDEAQAAFFETLTTQEKDMLDAVTELSSMRDLIPRFL